MTTDFKASQVQTHKVIVTGSFAGGSANQLLVYNKNADSSGSPNQGQIDPAKFSTSGVGSDAFLFISGGISTRGVAGSYGVSVIGGDLHVSGSLTVDGTYPSGGGGGGGNDYWQSTTSGQIFATGSLASITGSLRASFLSASNGLQITGSFTHGTNTVASTSNAHAQGDSTTASGAYSHAEGSGTSASSAGAHAEGVLTIANAQGSHAEGYGATASGQYSHAEGGVTTSSGQYSHAEGNSTIASGIGAHAEGNATTAYGQQAHSEGSTTLASGNFSHAEGYSTQATNQAAHAEGNSTTASGDASHAEGYLTTAAGYYTHAEGYNTTGSGYASHSEGVDTQAILSASHAEGYNTRVGVIGYSTLVNPIIDNGYAIYSIDSSYGDVTSEFTGQGVGPLATLIMASDGGGSDALYTFEGANFDGTNTFVTASNRYSSSGYYAGLVSVGVVGYVGLGDQVIPDGAGSTFTGHAEGESAVAAGVSSHVEGFGTVAAGLYSHAEGDRAVSAGNSSHAEGSITRAIGDISHAEGIQTRAIGSISHAEGTQTVSGLLGHSVFSGDDVSQPGNVIYTIDSASGDVSSDFGTSTDIVIRDQSSFPAVNYLYRVYSNSSYDGTNTHVTASQRKVANISNLETFYPEGTGYAIPASPGNFLIANVATNIFSSTGKALYSVGGGGSHTEGEQTVTSGVRSHAEGYQTIAIGESSHAEGISTMSGEGSHSEGNRTLAEGPASHAEGDRTVARGESSHAEGYQTVTSGSWSHSEGYQTVAEGVASHAEGEQTKSYGLYSHAEGSTTVASGSYSHSEGYQTVAEGGASHAEGSFTVAQGETSHSEGYLTVAQGAGAHSSGDHTLALGSYSTTTGYYTTGSGDYSYAGGNTTVAVGTYSYTGGVFTIASGSGQTVVGKYNVRGNTDSLFVVGNGTSDADIDRSDVVRVNEGTAGSGSFEVTGTILSTLGFSGSLTRLTDGTPYLIAGASISITTGSTGAVTIASSAGSGLATGKQYIASTTTTVTTVPLMIGQFSWVPSDYTGLTSVTVRAIMSTDGTANHTGSLQIYNLTSGSYIDLVDTPATSAYFDITSSIPTLVTSSNLLTGITNFDNSSTSVYEVRVSGSTANNTIIGGVELIFS